VNAFMPANRTQRSTLGRNSPYFETMVGDTVGGRSPATRLLLTSEYGTIRKCAKNVHKKALDGLELSEYGQNQSNTFLLEILKQKDDIQRKYDAIRLKYERLKGNGQVRELRSGNENIISETPEYTQTAAMKSPMNGNLQQINKNKAYGFMRKDTRNSRTEPPANLQYDGTRALEVVKIPHSSGVFIDNKIIGDEGQIPNRVNPNLNKSNTSIGRSHYKFKSSGTNTPINISVPRSERSHTHAISKYSVHNKEQSQQGNMQPQSVFSKCVENSPYTKPLYFGSNLNGISNS
jgi:hypothetical protein